MAIYPLSLLGLVVLWSFFALIAGPQALPSPWHVAGLFFVELGSGELLGHLFITLTRVAIAFVVAMAAGIVVGVAMGRSETIDRWFNPWLTVLLNVPALVTIVLAYLWIGLNETAALMAVALNKFPTVVVTIRQGVRALDPKYDEMAQVFGMEQWPRFVHVTLPQLGPFIAVAARSGIALIWKIVLVVEFLGRSNGVGFQIHVFFQLFDVGMVLVYAFSFVGVMLAIEGLILRPIEKRAGRWRRL